MDSTELQSTAPANDRIRAFTKKEVNHEIDIRTERRLKGIEAMGTDAIYQRLHEIDKEWDIDRVLMLNFSVLVFFQLMAARKNKKWLIGPLIQTPFLFMHATMGWCPPVLWFRPMGFRTRQEIEQEREALIIMLERKSELNHKLNIQ